MNELTSPRRYQAFGTVEGILTLDGDSSTLQVGETAFPIVPHIPKQVRKFHLPGQIQQFTVFPVALHGKLAFKMLKCFQSAVVGLKLKGCWENRWGVSYLVVYRNSLDNPTDRILRILVPIVWENAPTPDGQFWEIRAEVKETGLTVIEAEGPFKPPPRAGKYLPPVKAPALSKAIAAEKPALSVTEKPTATVKPATEPQTQTTATPLTIQEIRTMATPAKVSLTCKLNQLPAHRELPDKQIEFFLNDGSDRIFTVRVKPKMFKKLTDHGFAQWVAAIGGDLGPSTETGFELLNASIQVFEKKAPADASAVQEKAPAKEAKATPEKAAVSAVARPEPPKAEAQSGAGKRKSLLDGVRLK